ncbi:CPBP family glutamic-type intramembrane protease [Coleofasciculus chthonoplastes]|uniref:CPBP family glutamic-type intramembrane protease n=1 Tax=Coleofasciculus chthonoplastes TaxID=64178 RepID=UPI0032F9AA8E
MRTFKWVIWGLLGIICAIALIYFSPEPQPAVPQESSYTLSQPAGNQPSFYPLEQDIDPTFYHSVGDWVGRLILPNPEEITANSTGDWVWFQVYNAPDTAQDLIGDKVRLEWQETPQIQAYLDAVTTPIEFNQTTRNSQKDGNIHPNRLNGWSQVGPLQSLAGARPKNDVIVRLEEVIWAENRLKIARSPIQVSGRFYGLVSIVSTQGEWLTVRHYNPESDRFDGVEEVIRFRKGRLFSTPQQLEASPAGEAGWYIYGAKDKQGVFTVQAIAPRSLFQLQPDRVILGSDRLPNLWQNTRERQGTVATVLIDPEAKSKPDAISAWQAGDRALILHLFGGIGGENGDEQTIWATVTGHFSFGVAEIIRDPLTNELSWEIVYQQVYAHNPNGIIAGNVTWANYMGDLHRGWLGTRPVVDVLIKLEAVTQDYNFDGVILSPLQALKYQLNVMMSRYRTGDGTGSAIVTPASSCVQDSNQALYIAIEQIKQQVATTPQIQAWLQQHPNHPQTQRFQALVALGKELEQNLTPLGVVRSDWKQNAETLAGVGDRLIQDNDLFAGILSWRTIMPRRGQDIIADLLLDKKAKLWLLQSFQVPGGEESIFPVAPTVLLGQVPVLSTLLIRVVTGLITLPSGWGWLICVSIGLGYAAIAVPFGLMTGFLQFRWDLNWNQFFLTLVFPAFSEELVFRGLLLPSFLENASAGAWLFGLSLSTILFILYHPLNARYFYPPGYPMFWDWRFLVLAGWLGIACGVSYGVTRSLWSAVSLHWLAVIIWLFVFGGKGKLHVKQTEMLHESH